MTLGLYRNAARKDEIGSRGKLVYMKITGRERGAGTLKFPDHIYAECQGVKPDFTCERKYFRKTMGADSIEVRYDSVSGAAVLPGSGAGSPRGIFVCDDHQGISSSNLEEHTGIHKV